jgi:anti-sigma regulatory factor (Ser/Thr protein kinase)
MAPRLARAAVKRHIPPQLAPLEPKAAFLATELVTNAVVHAGSIDDGLCLSVTDFGPGEPVMRAPDPNGGGYGLHLVNKLATRWGHEMLHPRGKRVWFELHREDQAGS